VVDMSSGTLGLTTGKFHTCAIIQNRNVKCWGYNQFGQQGNGSTADNHIPKKAIALGAGVLSIYAGGLHTCALTMDDKVKCWGDNSEGQLGVGPGIDKSTVPIKVGSLDNIVVGMSLGAFHSCADIINGGLKCWGDNWAGQLGNNTNLDSPWPSDVVNLSEAIYSVAGGDSHTCAATATGKVLCWGSNNIGQLGNAMSAQSLTPVDVVGLGASISKGAAGAMHACVLTAAGGVKCWGNNKYGQLGDGTTIDRLTPVNVVGLASGVVKVEAGALHTCAVLVSGGVKCWGENVDGQLGDGTTNSSSVPVNVYGLTSGITDVGTGASHTCALTTVGGVKCWGKNGRGRLGDGTNVDRLTPVDVLGQTTGVVALELGQQHSCVLKQSGSVRCWGANYSGQLGDGTDIDRWTSVAVGNLGSGVVGLTAGESHTCALFNNGDAKCWGANYSGELGDGTFNTHYVPVPVTGLPGAATVLEAGHFHTCAVLGGGAVYCWGDNWNGQIGDGSTTEQPSPVAVPSLQSGVTDLFAGGKFTCGRMGDASVMCWGAGGNGQLGDGALPWEPTPIGVIGLTPASVEVNFESGQVGSYFHILGEDFLPGTSAQVTLNGYIFSETIPIDPDGSFNLVFSTVLAGEGDYFAYFESTLRAMAIFRLDPNAPLQPLEGSGPILDVPAGIGLGVHSYLPMGYR
jgi:alpha-tubulin suppressor-like RCC1 family protein